MTLDDDPELHEQKTILLLLGNDTQFSVQKAHLRLFPLWNNALDTDSKATTIPLANTHEVSAGALAALLPHLPRWAADGLPEKPAQIALPNHRALADIIANPVDVAFVEGLVDDDGGVETLVAVLLAAHYMGLKAVETLVLAALALLFRHTRQVSLCM